jgi:sigma-54 dependent transcriptional regulator, acetoin dehydrogenase operon transcriptional activator AcoR
MADSRLMHAAKPVLDRLEETFSGVAMGLLLTDAQGRVLDRRVEGGSLTRHLNGIQLAPGFSAADLLGISRATIYRKINTYGISVAQR